MDNSKKISETTLNIGGLFRCCTDLTLPEYVKKHADDKAVTATVIKCEHCKNEMILNEHFVWTWLH